MVLSGRHIGHGTTPVLCQLSQIAESLTDGDYSPKACDWPPLARQDAKEHESSDDIRSRSDDSYSPRRHWCSI